MTFSILLHGLQDTLYLLCTVMRGHQGSWSTVPHAFQKLTRVTVCNTFLSTVGSSQQGLGTNLDTMGSWIVGAGGL